MSDLANLSDGALAAELAQRAGELLLELREHSSLSGKELGNEGDAAANRLLMPLIREARPGDGYLSEESKDTKERLEHERVWIIDPVDGTREFGERRSDWAVHVGLAVGGEAVTGAVGLPGLAGGTVLRSDEPRDLPPAPDTPRMVVSRTRPAKEALAVAESIGADLLPMGSAGAKAMAVVRGEAEIYLHSGGQYEWDSCAPIAVAAAHGLHCSRLDGSPMRYNREDVYLPDLLICRQELAGPILELLSGLRQEAASES